MKRTFAILLICSSLGIFSCSKNDIITNQPSSFAATVDGTDRAFADFISVISEVSPIDGSFYLNIVAERGISSDSSNQIKFSVPDFTREGTTGERTYSLGPTFTGQYIEWKNLPAGPKANNHQFQSGQLKIKQTDKNLISGEFNFIYHTFDANGQKTGEHTITNGRFNNLTITRQ
jgi:hypothetical protein